MTVYARFFRLSIASDIILEPTNLRICPPYRSIVLCKCTTAEHISEPTYLRICPPCRSIVICKCTTAEHISGYVDSF